MNKVRVLLLSGCSRCRELTAKLDALNISYEMLDVDLNDKFASAVEKLVGTGRYPMALLEHSPMTIILYLANDVSQLTLQSVDNKNSKLGCINLDAMVDNLNLLINN